MNFSRYSSRSSNAAVKVRFAGVVVDCDLRISGMLRATRIA
jgi:hypothetical protein